MEDLEGTGLTPRRADRVPVRTAAALPPEWTAASAQEAMAIAGSSRGETLAVAGLGSHWLGGGWVCSGTKVGVGL